MTKHGLLGVAFTMGTLLLHAATSAAAEPEVVVLPPPHMDGGMPLMQALKQRQTSRAFSREALPAQVLSDLLWAAFGINRPQTGGRTAPSARNWQEIEIYLSSADGVFLYDASHHSLERILTEDIRRQTGLQAFVAEAPINLIFVANASRMEGAAEEDKLMYSAADAAFIAQNVYLFCASERLATVVRGALDRPALAKVMKLASNRRVILAQFVGYLVKSD
jgi:SagB-type dehydrogenase family enzyme